MVRINWNQFRLFFLFFFNSTRLKSATVQQLLHQLSHPSRRNGAPQEENRLGTSAGGHYCSDTEVRCPWSEAGKLHGGEEHKALWGTKPQPAWATSTFFCAVYQLDPRSVWVAAITKEIPPTPTVNKLHLAKRVHDFCFKRDGLCSSHLVFEFCWSVLIPISHTLSPSFTLCLLSHRGSTRPPHNRGAAPRLPTCTQCLECRTWRETTATHCRREVMFVWLNRCRDASLSPYVQVI